MPNFCPTCGKPLQYENAEICPNCGVRIQPKQQDKVRDPWTAVLFSFFVPGWGQWYNGKTWDGLIFFGVLLVSYFLLFIFAAVQLTQPLAGIFLIILAVIIVIDWFYGMYDAYKTADRINKVGENFSGKSRLFWLPVIFLVMVIAAVIAAFIFGMTAAQYSYGTVPIVTIPTVNYNIVEPTTTPQPVQTISSAPIVIDSNGNPGWVRYTSYIDHFSIYKPSDWTVKELSKSQVPNEENLDISLSMDQFVYIFTPNYKGFLMIYGVDYTGTLYSLFNDPGKTRISDAFYEDFIKGLYEGFTPSNPMKLIGVIRDTNYYSVNGYPARKVTLNIQVSGQSMTTDCYVIAHENFYYIESYWAMAGSTQSDASTANGIMRTFSIN